MELLKISDPGHGWLRVPRAILRNSGYRPTEWSYMDRDYYYLEEDCDAPKFMDLMRKKGTLITVNNKYLERTQIRNKENARV